MRSSAARTTLCLCLIIAVGLSLRLYRLGAASLWHDELRTATRVQLPFAQMMHDLEENPFPPLYYLLMRAWVGVFGDTEFSLRFPSAIASTLLLLVIFLFTRDLFGERAGLVTAFLAAIHPYGVYYAQEAKMYSLLWLLAALSFFFLRRFIVTKAPRELAWYAVASIASIYTLYIGFIFLLIHNLIFLFSAGRGKAAPWIKTQLLILLSYLPWAGMFLAHLTRRTGTDWIPAPGSYWGVLATTVLPRISGGMIEQTRFLAAGFSLLLSAYGLLRISRSGPCNKPVTGRNSLSFLLLWITVPLILYGAFHLLGCPFICELTERYTGFIFIPLVILAGAGIASCARIGRVALISAALLINGFTQLKPLFAYPYRLIHNDDYRAFQSLIRARGGAAPLIFTGLYPRVVTYYNPACTVVTDTDIPGYLKKSPAAPDSFFVVYRTADKMNTARLQRSLPGYRLLENYFSLPNGFLWFKKKGT